LPNDLLTLDVYSFTRKSLIHEESDLLRKKHAFTKFDNGPVSKSEMATREV